MALPITEQKAWSQGQRAKSMVLLVGFPQEQTQEMVNSPTVDISEKTGQESQANEEQLKGRNTGK